MRTVTVPDFNDPIKIKINDTEYVYRAGQTVEVPDAVASVIDNIKANAPKEVPHSNFATIDDIIEAIKTKVDKSGDTITGNLEIKNGKITFSGTTPNPAIVANGKRIAQVGTPTFATDVTNKTYADGLLVVDEDSEVV